MRRISPGEAQFCQNNDNFGIYSDPSCNLNQGVSSDGTYSLAVSTISSFLRGLGSP